MSGAEASVGQWFLHSALGGSLMLLLACAAMRCTLQPARRQRLGEMGLTAALVVALLSLAPAWLLVSVPTAPTTAAVQSPPVASAPQSAAELPAEGAWAFAPAPGDFLAPSTPQSLPTEPSAKSGSSTPTARAPLNGVPWLTLVAFGYGLAAGAIVARWLLGYLSLWRLVRSAESAPRRADRLLANLAGKGRRPRLLVSRRLSVPISCGLLRPTIVLPESLCDAPASELGWVLAHELTHLERRDPWTCLLFALGQAVFFYLPWFWLLRRHVRLCQEYVADAGAADCDQRADYAQFLLHLTTAPATPVCATGVSGHTSDLFRRIAMLLQNPLAVERRCPRLWSLATAGGLLALGVLVAGVGVRANAAPPLDDRVAVNSPDDTKKDEPKKDQPKKDDNKDEPKKEKKRIFGGDFEMPDIEEILKNLPQNIDPEKLAEVRKRLEQMRGEMRKRMDEVRRNFPEGVQGRFPFRAMRGMAMPSGRLGIRVDRPSAVLADQLELPKGQGLVIQDVLPDSAAAKAGLKPHDILLQFDGKAVSNDPMEFHQIIRDAKSDTPLTLVVKRKGKDETIKGVTLAEPKNDPRIRRRAPGNIREFVPPVPPVKSRDGASEGFPGEVF